MFTFANKLELAELKAKMAALNKSQAVIEFNMDGTILHANENFLNAVGYTMGEIEGNHHSMFVDRTLSTSPEYKIFWQCLNKGEYQSGEFRRLAKGGKDIWIQASYNPIMDHKGRPYKVIKYASDITTTKQMSADYSGQIDAIGKSQAVISFNLDGTIIDANQNFLSAINYAIEEIKGRHHSMFVEPEFARSSDYQAFWEALRRGEYQTAEYKRLGKSGREIWIQASYNPIKDMNGRFFKVVKYAADVTAQVKARNEKETTLRFIDTNLQEISDAMSLANNKSASAASASTETASNVQTVASGAEELNASVREIAESMQRSKEAVDKAFDQTVSADCATQRLNEAATSMSGIISLIQNIAQQINLLSLNATIESARAGEAGKGFAVVAQEVKNLATQASEATEQISREIVGMQNVSGEVVSSLQVIRSSMELVREYVAGTAGAVEEQSTVAREMSRNMQMAATMVVNISNDVGEIAASASQADASTQQVKRALQSIAA